MVLVHATTLNSKQILQSAFVATMMDFRSLSMDKALTAASPGNDLMASSSAFLPSSQQDAITRPSERQNA